MVAGGGWGAAPRESPHVFKAALSGKRAVQWRSHRVHLQPWSCPRHTHTLHPGQHLQLCLLGLLLSRVTSVLGSVTPSELCPSSLKVTTGPWASSPSHL